MALTADREYETVPGATIILGNKAGAADTLYKGGLLNYGTDGYLKVAADVASEVFAGYCKKQHVADGSAHLDIEVEEGLLWVEHSGAAQTDVGTLAYATADDTIAHSASNVTAMGLVVGWKSGYLLIDTRIRALS
jgi:hypothetical protein